MHSLEILSSLFISHGDFYFPFNFDDYFLKQWSTWLHQTGAVNLDGIIRLPGRLPIILAFFLLGNVAASYFYIFFCYSLIAVSMFFFIRHYFDIKSNFTKFSIILLYTFNPVFLGYTSKIGLIAAIGLLPLALVFVQKYTLTKKYKYLIGIILCLNFSLIHPFTFFVNLIACLGYFVYIIKVRKINIKGISKVFINISAWGILLSLYFILPIITTGSVDKAVLSQDTATATIDYSGLITIANAGNSLSALMLDKDVFLDYMIYSPNTYYFYAIGIIGLYTLIIGLYLYKRPKLKKSDQRIFGIAFILALCLVFMTSGHDIINAIYMAVVNLPGGWIVRSPLKWQLYIPFLFIVLIALLSTYVVKKRTRVYFSVVILLVALLQSGYLGLQVVNNILIPKQIEHFADIISLPQDKRLLYIASTDCVEYMDENNNVLTELNQVFNSGKLQVKRINSNAVKTTKLGSYDYILTCADKTDSVSKNNKNFQILKNISDIFKLYKNDDLSNSPFASTIPIVFAETKPSRVNEKDRFMQNKFKSEYNYSFVTKDDDSGKPALLQPFAEINSSNFTKESINVTVTNLGYDQAKLYLNSGQTFYNLSGNSISLGNQDSLKHELQSNNTGVNIPVVGDRINLSLKAPGYKFNNMIENGSFESGPWTKNVENCYEYDSSPRIEMEIRTQSSNQHYLELKSERHVACTSKKDIDVIPNSKMLLEFKYKSTGNSAGVSIAFNDKAATDINLRPKAVSNDDWTEYSELLDIPKDATSAKLTLLSYPDITINKFRNTSFDDIRLIQVPDNVTDYFLMYGDDNLGGYNKLDFTSKSQTEYVVEYIGQSEEVVKIPEVYNKNWHVFSEDGKDLSRYTQHLAINNGDNAWKIDMKKICEENLKCTSDSDGIYRVSLKVKYVTQNSFYIGGVISLTFFLILICLSYYQSRRK